MKTSTLASKILLIGWDAADWKTIRPIMEAGHMPTLQKMMNEGAHGRLKTLDPPLSPILWTSIATGKLPYKHGIHGFTEPKPDRSGVRPITNLNRKTKAFWNIFSQEGLKTNVVGWWPSHPAEKINGTMVSNFYQSAPSTDITKPWEMTKGTVHPEEKAEIISKLRIHPAELTAQHILPFVPNAAQVDQKTDSRLTNVAKVLADCSTIQAATTYLMEREEWDVTAVYFDAIDHFCHGFMKYHPPKRDHIPAEDFELYKDVVTAGYRYHDMMLDRLLQLAGPDTTVILISDHGFHADHLRPETIAKEPAGPADEHSPYGIICMKGPGIKQGTPIIGATLLDIAPTLLSLAGLPVGKDMDGKILTNALESQSFPLPVNSWDQIDGDCGMHPEGTELSSEIEEQAMQQLVALGYVEDPGDHPGAAVDKTINENSFYLAKSYFSTGQIDEAIAILEDLWEKDSEQLRYGLHLIQAYMTLARTREAREIFEQMREMLQDTVDEASLSLIEGRILLAENKTYKALDFFRQAAQKKSDRAGIQEQLGKVFFQLNKWEDAEKAYTREVEIDPENATGWHGLGAARLRMGKTEEAAQDLLHAINLTYHVPIQHYHLGEALYELEQYDIAVQAFTNCLKLDPKMNQARRWLAKIYLENLDQPQEAESILGEIKDHIKGTITIVSGLPRSGTSMMMQMLDNGGMEVFTDSIRESDENNPLGYYEHEAVKRIARDKRWLPLADGKAVKIVAPLLKHLPQNYHYKIIFMERDIQEVVTSQHKMLARMGKIPADVFPYQLQANFEETLKEVKQWEQRHKNVEICYLPYQEVIDNPFVGAMKVADFLKGQLAVESMAQVVNPELYREKSSVKHELT